METDTQAKYCNPRCACARRGLIGEREGANLVVWTADFSIYIITYPTFGRCTHRNTRILILCKLTFVQFYVPPHDVYSVCRGLKMSVDESSTRNRQQRRVVVLLKLWKLDSTGYQERARRRQHIASETPEDRDTRLSRRRERDRATRREHIAFETPEQGETRLSTSRAQD